MTLGPITPVLRIFDEAKARKGYGFARPSIEAMPWGTRDLRVTDPFGNRLTFTDADAPASPGDSAP